MKSISRRKILISIPNLLVLDDNVNTAESAVEIPNPILNCHIREVKMVGTFNGIVLMVLVCYSDVWTRGTRKHDTANMILYNPFTRASKIVPDPYPPLKTTAQSYGFCYGASPDDLKIVRLRSKKPWKTCDVFNLKTGTWNMPKILFQDNYFNDGVGTFVNGILYWNADSQKIVALNVNEMVFSNINLPYPYVYIRAPLGTLHGQLCMIIENPDDCALLEMWVMMEHGVENSWSKSYSFKINYQLLLRVVTPTDDGRILLAGLSAVVNYDPLKQTYKTLGADLLIGLFRFRVRGMEYVESLTSPFEICFV